MTKNDANGVQPTLILKLPIAVRWRDLDAFNHVNNSNFLTFVEETRLAWMARIEGTWFDDTVAPIVAAVHMNYRRQMKWPARVVVELYATRLGNTSLTLGHRIVDADDEEALYGDGDVVMVWIDPKSGRPVPLPEAVRSAAQSPFAGGASAEGATTSK